MRFAHWLMACGIFGLLPAGARAQSIVINELHYHPTSANEDEEFIEFYNPGPSPVNLNNWDISDGVDFEFPAGSSIAAGGYVCVVVNLTAFRAAYGNGPVVAGVYTGRLDNSGEIVSLENSSNIVVDTFTYDDSNGWPIEADGGGYSLELSNPLADNTVAANWYASSVLGGTPGAANSPGQGPVIDIYADNVIHEFRVTFSQPDFWQQLEDNADAENYIPGDVTYSGRTYPNVGIRLKGNSSQNLPPGTQKLPFKFDFNEFTADQTLFGYDNLNLGNAFKDPTFMREKIMSEYIARYIPTPRVGYVHLLINNESWGLYINVEQVDKDFLQSRFANAGGNLYKGDPRGTMQWQGIEQSAYQDDYELETNEAANDWSDLLAMLNTLNNSTPANLEANLPNVLDVDAALWHLALNNAFVNLDSYIGSGHNYYLYSRTDTDQFEPIFWDVNEAFGTFTQGMSISQRLTLPIDYIPNPVTSRPLTSHLLNDVPAWRTDYENKLKTIVQQCFDEPALATRIAQLHTLINTSVQADTKKLYTYQQYQQNQTQDVMIGGLTVFGLTRFTHDRKVSLNAQLSPTTPATTVGWTAR